MATVTYIGPPSPGWADDEHTTPDDPDARWVDDLGRSVWLPDGRTRRVLVDEALDVPDEWLDEDHPDGRVWPSTLWRTSGGPADGRRIGELRRGLAARGLPTDGDKATVLARLLDAERADPTGPAGVDARRFDLGTPDNPGDFPDAPAADEGREQLVADTPPPPDDGMNESSRHEQDGDV